MSGKRGRKTSYLRQRFPKRMQKKLVALFVTIVLAFVGLVGEVTRINAKNGEKYTKIVLDQQQYNSRVIPFKRGDILDRNGTVIATSERVYNVILDCYVMMSAKKEEDRQAKIDHVKIALQESFEIAPDAIDKVIENDPSDRYEILKRKVSYEQAVTYKEKYGDLDCIWLEEDYIRYYPYDSLASDLIGFTVSGNVGNAGIEAAYNSILNGTDGREYGYLDADATFERTVKEAVNGYTVVSTIDITLQSIIEKHIRAFNEEHKNEVRPGEGSKNTAVIIMNPNTGEILAMSGKKIVNGTIIDDTTSLLTSPITPGSVVKGASMLVGYNTGAIHIGERLLDECVKVAGVAEKCSFRTLGVIDDITALAKSSNVYQFKIALRVNGQEYYRNMKMNFNQGAFDVYRKMYHSFGLGVKTEIDLPVESLGYTSKDRAAGNLLDFVMGQYETYTPIQLSQYISTIANGGERLQPHLLKEVRSSSSNDEIGQLEFKVEKKVLNTIDTKPEYMNRVKEGFIAVLNSPGGYGVGYMNQNMKPAGKTGTSQSFIDTDGNGVIDTETITSSFIGYAPYDNPKMSIVVTSPDSSHPNSNNDYASLVTYRITQRVTEKYSEMYGY